MRNSLAVIHCKTTSWNQETKRLKPDITRSKKTVHTRNASWPVSHCFQAGIHKYVNVKIDRNNGEKHITGFWEGDEGVWNRSGSECKGQVSVTASLKRTTAEIFWVVFWRQTVRFARGQGVAAISPSGGAGSGRRGGRQRRPGGTNWDWRSLRGARFGAVTRALPRKRSDKMSCQRPAVHVTRTHSTRGRGGRMREPGPPAAPAFSPFYCHTEDIISSC